MRRVILGALCYSFAILGSVRADMPRPKPVTVPFELLPTRHMAVRIRINGKGPYRVIFDTGSPVLLLNTKVAHASGLLPKNARPAGFNLFGAAGQQEIRVLELGPLRAEKVPAVVMDHPTLEAANEVLGPVEGIVGFPLFARYRMTLDYQARQLTFVPNGYRPPDVLQELAATLLNRKGKEEPVVLAPAALWGFAVHKEARDQTAGVMVQSVFPGGAAETAGLRPGDRLLTLDGRWTDSVADCYAAAGSVSPGTPVSVVVRRGGKEQALTVTPRPGL